MIDFKAENCVTLSEAARLLASIRGKRASHPMTLYRWATKGLLAKSGDRVRLETIPVGGILCTSKEALDRFFRSLQKDASTNSVEIHATLNLEAREAAARDTLQKHGILPSK